MTKPLKGLKVLDLTRVLSGPFCTMLLADMGAEVIKIERPGIGDDSRHFGPFKEQESGYYMLFNRGKKSITLNLKDNQGKEIFKNMVKKCDVVVENFKPGVMEKLGLNYEVLSEINPQIVYCSISGFGNTSSFKKRPAYDLVAQAIGGMMSITGYPDKPPVKVGSSLADMSSGLFAAYGIALAVLNREKTGKGQSVDISMIDSIFTLLESNVVRYSIGEEVPTRIGNRHPISAPFDTFLAKDGYIVIAIANDALFAKFAETLGQPELSQNKKFNTDFNRLQNQAELKQIIESWLQDRTVKEASELLLDSGIPCAPIYDIKQTCESKHIQEREMMVELNHPKAGKVRVPGNPVKLSDTPASIKEPSPSLGEHNLEVLTELVGLSEGDIKELIHRGVIDKENS
ncbi:CaiB/BaiF CoA transferase family protein [Natranaerobius trueperi]|uniref:Carnitine dehydratase n=1 Tax=Natranaerobius trueperi TaxID=759412 RepID=A0A226BYS2_9FIRM|nr:CoA transferase [Natranaerobius trueperi]OWZ84075.1 carnitine dehydratase [Natranaerobius trueperi]